VCIIGGTICFPVIPTAMGLLVFWSAAICPDGKAHTRASLAASIAIAQVHIAEFAPMRRQQLQKSPSACWIRHGPDP
jgi:hypothetical protein